MTNQKFEDRLRELQKSRGSANVEIGAAANTYERLLTAKAIGVSVFGEEVSPNVVAAIFAELSEEVRILYESDRRMFEE